MNSLFDVIRERHSCRTYDAKKIDSLVIAELKSYININNKGLFGEEIAIDIVEKGVGADKQIKLDYGIISNHSTYIVGKTKSNTLSRMSYGFVVEKAVLKATALGLSTCWVGYFENEYFADIVMDSGTIIPSIVIMGYQGKASMSEKLLKLTAGSRNRKEWSQLFFEDSFSVPLIPKNAGLYEDALEMLRLAPSSGNTQPWRVIMESSGKKFHFFKKPISQRYEEKGLHDVDMGIALSHFDLVAKQYQLNGNWERLPNIDKTYKGRVEYMVSWVEV